MTRFFAQSRRGQHFRRQLDLSTSYVRNGLNAYAGNSVARVCLGFNGRRDSTAAVR
jgi:hypothetical protein